MTDENQFNSAIPSQLPLSKRYQYEQQQKNKWIQEQQQRKQDQEAKREMEGVTFKPNISQNSKKRRTRTPDQFYQDNLQWKQTQIKQREKKKNEIEYQKQSYCSFQPQTNQKSTRLVKQMDFYERLVDKEVQKKEKLKQIEKEITPSFQPKTLSYKKTNPKKYQLYKIQVDKSADQSFEFFDQMRKLIDDDKQINDQLDQFVSNKREPCPNFMENTSAIQKLLQTQEKQEKENDQEKQLLNDPSFGSKQMPTVTPYMDQGQNQLAPMNPYMESRIKRQYFNDKITTIAENIQNLFKNRQIKQLKEINY